MLHLSPEQSPRGDLRVCLQSLECTVPTARAPWCCKMERSRYAPPEPYSFFTQVLPVHQEGHRRSSQFFQCSSQSPSRCLCYVCLLWSFRQQFFCYWCMHDRPTEICQSSQLVLVYPPVHWDLFLFGIVAPQVGCTMCHLSFGHTVVSTPLLLSSGGRTVSQQCMNAILRSTSARTYHGSEFVSFSPSR